jgi:amidase
LGRAWTAKRQFCTVTHPSIDRWHPADRLRFISPIFVIFRNADGEYAKLHAWLKPAPPCRLPRRTFSFWSITISSMNSRIDNSSSSHIRDRSDCNEAIADAAAAPATQRASRSAVDGLRRRIGGSARDNLDRSLELIESLDRGGPQLRSMIGTSPLARGAAEQADRDLEGGVIRSAIHGRTLAIKDNIAAADGTATTAGSLALAGIVPTRDATVVEKLRSSGAVIVGKANLSEWAHIRGGPPSGWSAVGGQTLNPHALDRSPCGSSSGSAVAVAAGIVDMAIGTETNGSITSPAAFTSVVGLKPTVGLVSRDGVVPISHTQDTAGPITRNVTDAAALLSVIAGPDPRDDVTLAAPAAEDYVAALDRNALKGARIGVATDFFTKGDPVGQHMRKVVAGLKSLGATLDYSIKLPVPEWHTQAQSILLHELKDGIPKWLQRFAPHAGIASLDDVIAFNEAHPEEEVGLFGQDMFVRTRAMGGLEARSYRRALAYCQRASRRDGLDRALGEHRLDAIVAPTRSETPWLIDYAGGDRYRLAFPGYAAVAGYPHLTVPAGTVYGLPVGLSFVGPAWSEAKLLSYGYAFEQSGEWQAKPTYVERSSGMDFARRTR